MTDRWLRYFATTTDSSAGRTALAFLKGLCRIAKVRLLPLDLPPSPAWSPFVMGLLATPTGDYVNIVCADPARWTWLQTIPTCQRAPLPSEDPSGIGGGEPVTGRIELYTAGVRNVLIAPAVARGRDQIDAAKKYDIVIVSDPTHAAWWLTYGDGVVPHVMPENLIDQPELRSLVLGH